jgi:5-keto 4-deoxyuronate isomerase
MNNNESICSQCGSEYNRDVTVNNFLEICNDCQLYMGLTREEDLKIVDIECNTINTHRHTERRNNTSRESKS